jgi:hypothetical protein
VGCSDMLFPAVDMHVYPTPGAVVDSGSGFFAADRTFHSYSAVFSGTLLFSLATSLVASLASVSGGLFLLSVT